MKELQTVRNRWAHAGTAGIPFDDVYRDLDTLQRFVATIEADRVLIQEIQDAKTSLLKPQPAQQKKTMTSAASDGESATGLQPGQIVALKSNPSVRGAIVGVIPGKPEPRYQVFVNGETQTFYASQIQAETREEKNFHFLPSHTFHCYLTAL